MPQKIDNLFSTTGKPAAGAAERFSQRAGDDIDSAHHTAIFVRAASSFAKKTSRMRIVNHRQRVILLSEITNGREVRNRAVHGETAVSSNQFKARILRRAQLRLQICHVVVLVAKTLRFAEADAVDDAGVIQFIANHGVVFGEKRFE